MSPFCERLLEGKSIDDIVKLFFYGGKNVEKNKDFITKKVKDPIIAKQNKAKRKEEYKKRIERLKRNGKYEAYLAERLSSGKKKLKNAIVNASTI